MFGSDAYQRGRDTRAGPLRFSIFKFQVSRSGIGMQGRVPSAGFGDESGMLLTLYPELSKFGVHGSGIRVWGSGFTPRGKRAGCVDMLQQSFLQKGFEVQDFGNGADTRRTERGQRAGCIARGVCKQRPARRCSRSCTTTPCASRQVHSKLFTLTLNPNTKALTLGMGAIPAGQSR